MPANCYHCYGKRSTLFFLIVLDFFFHVKDAKPKLTKQQREELKAEKERAKAEAKAKREAERLKKEQEKQLREQEKKYVVLEAKRVFK